MTDPTAPLPDDELAAIEARVEQYQVGDFEVTFPSAEDIQALLAALRAERTARERVEAAADRLCYAAEDVIMQRSGQWRTSGKALTRLEAETKAARAALAPATGEKTLTPAQAGVA